MQTLVDGYGPLSATLAADYYDELRDAADVAERYVAKAGSYSDPVKVKGAADWASQPLFDAVDPLDALERMRGSSQRLVQDWGRQTMLDNIASDPARPRFARMPSGKTCKFCRMLAGRGAVYHTAASAGALSDFHDLCDCQIVTSYTEGDLPYDPKKYQGEDPGQGLTEPVTRRPPPVDVPPPPFEEEYVGKIESILKTGKKADRDRNLGDARRILADPATPDLSRANMREALRRVEQPTLVKPVGPRVPPRTNTPTRGALTSDQYEVMRPSRSWTPEKRQQILTELGKSENGKVLADTLEHFQDGGSIARLRTTIDKRLRGEHLPALSEARADSVLDAIRNSPTDMAPDTLYRGMTVKGRLENVLGKYVKDADLDLSLTSFTADRKVATRFQSMTSKGGGETRIMVELVGSDKHALPIQNLPKDRRLFNEKEWVSAGRFRIVEAKKLTYGSMLLRIEQIGTL